MSTEELSQVHRLLQQVFSLVVSRLKADDPVVTRISDRLFDKLSEVLSSSMPLTLRRSGDGFYLNAMTLPDSFVLRRLFDTSGCSAVTFKSGLDKNDLREFVQEAARCFQHGVPPFPVEGDERRYAWVFISSDAPKENALAGDRLVMA